MLDWKPCQPPNLPARRGRFVRIARFDPQRDGDDLFAAIGGEGNAALWRYVPIGPFANAPALLRELEFMAQHQGCQTHVLRDGETGQALGMASYMRIRPEVGSAEVGAVVFSDALKRTPAATEAMFAMASHLFDALGYRRYEWKCDSENAASRRAAERFGFTPEGVFRQDMVVKGRNRDTAWYSMLDGEWPAIRTAFERWLEPANFDAAGRQRRSLSEIREDA